MDLNNLQKIDAFEEVSIQSNTCNSCPVHIRIQARNRRKSILTVQGLDDDLDLKKICKYLRKKLSCNGTVVTDKEHGEIIQLQGDHRASVKTFLTIMEICTPEQVIVHGA
jgi:translation initiation factor 1